MVIGDKVSPALDQMPSMTPFVNNRLSRFDFCIQEYDHLDLMHEREVYRFDLADGQRWCSMMVDEDDNPCYRFSSGSVMLHDRFRVGDVYLQWNGDLDELRYMLWLAYAHTALKFGAVPIHSSVVVCNGFAVLCLGESGTGKSTHTSLWLKNFPNTYLLNDDSPILRVEKNGIWVYGSPWSGKTPCYRTERVPVAALIRLEQRPENSIRRLHILEAFAALHPSCPPTLAHDERCTDKVVEFIGGVITRVPVYRLGCLPDDDAAQLSFKTIFPALCK